MTDEAERILEAAMKLPDAERAKLASLLADSVGDGSSDADIEAAWIAEAKRRWDDIVTGRATTTPFEEVNRKVRAMLERGAQRATG